MGKKPIVVESKVLPEEKVDMLAATSTLQRQAAEIRNSVIDWDAYIRSGLIEKTDFDFFRLFIEASQEGKEQIISLEGNKLAQVFLTFLSQLSREQTLRYILITIDDMIQDIRESADIFMDESLLSGGNTGGRFLNMLTGVDEVVIYTAATIVARIACWSTKMINKTDLTFYLSWLKDQLKRLENEYMQSVLRCLQMLLRIDEYRSAFVKIDGITALLGILNAKLNFQVEYQAIFCIWVLTFNTELAQRINKFNVIPILADILCDSVKEKVTRIILATFTNLIQKPLDPSISKEHSIIMVQCKVLKQLSILEQRKFDDEDIMLDIKYLTEKLQASVQDLSSFDEYSQELKSGRLEWSPVHRSAQFWRENAHLFNEKNYEMLKILLHILESSNDNLVVSVALYDIGEYVRYYPRGKLVIEHLGGKQLVMQLLSHEDPNVRYEALLAVQKIMVHNWAYLGKHLEKELEPTKGPVKAE